MAEIKIEKKKPVWPWVIVILIVLAIVIYFIYTNQENDDYNDGFSNDVTTEQIDDSVNQQSANEYESNQNYTSTFDQFSAFEESISDSTRIAVDTSYTKKAFSNLAMAVVGKANQNALEDSKALQDLRDYTTLNTNISSANEGAEVTKNVATASAKITTVLEAIQAKSFPELQSQTLALKQMSTKIDGSISMDKQQSNINAFLKKCKDVLQAMNN